MHLALSELLLEPGAKTRHVYFPTQGFVSLLASVGERTALEVGMVECEGMIGAQLALWVVIAPCRCW